MKHLLIIVSLVVLPSLSRSAEVIEGEMAGYRFAPAEKVPEEFNGGFSLYAAAWPLVGTYPGHRFKTGLCGTWMHPQWTEAEKPKEKCYTDIEGGLGTNPRGKPLWQVMDAKQAPADAKLTQHRFETPQEKPQEPRTTPDDANSCWKKPGPVAGPFKAKLGDGSTVTYYWYRFADQPAMLNADLTPEEREQVQQRVEKLHRAWTRQELEGSPKP